MLFRGYGRNTNSDYSDGKGGSGNIILNKNSILHSIQWVERQSVMGKRTHEARFQLKSFFCLGGGLLDERNWVKVKQNKVYIMIYEFNFLMEYYMILIK